MLEAMRAPRTEPDGQLRLISGGCAAAEAVDPADDAARDGRVAADLATVLAHASDERLIAAPLTLPLGLSICMARHHAGAEGLISAMHALRVAVLAVSGLDPAQEPVPLVVGEPKVAAVAFAHYLRDLLVRAAHACAAAPDAVALAAAAELA